MQTVALESPTSIQPQNRYMLLELTVNNHPGVMSHVCNLFAHRAFNVEGILCLPIDNDRRSRIWLLVKEDRRLNQMMTQLLKLEDVLDVQRHSADRDTFVQVERFFWPNVTV